MTPSFRKSEVVLSDVGSEETGQQLRLALTFRSSGIDIQPERHGCCTSPPTCGAPIYLEYHNDELRLLVWADINSEEPTHVIGLNGARESCRVAVVQ